jgi:hypothetical protein
MPSNGFIEEIGGFNLMELFLSPKPMHNLSQTLLQFVRFWQRGRGYTFKKM